MPNDFETMMEEHLKKEPLPKRGSLIKTTVLQINSDFIVVDIGAKAEAVISKKEFTTIPSIGDEITVYVENASPSKIILSYSKALKQGNISEIETAYEAKTPLSATIKKILPNGFIADLMGWEAFIPFSQISLSFNLDDNEKKKFLSQTLPFIILKYEMRAGRPSILIGRKEILLQEKSGKVSEVLETIHIGDVFDGKVVKINEKSILVEIMPEVIGLVRIGDISWSRIKSPSEKVKEKEIVKVKVIEIDKNKNQILLSIKDAQGNVWQDFMDKTPIDTILEGTVDSLTEGFMIVNLSEGVKGFLHKSNISWVNPFDILKSYKIGQKINIKILDYDIAKKKISLGVKQIEKNPFITFAETHKVGDVVEGTIVRKTDFALFVDLGNYVQAMIHKNDLSWNIKEQNLNHYNIGDKLTCTLDKIETATQKISCTLKQKEKNPWGNFAQNNSIGSIIKGTVKSLDPKGFVIEFKEGVEAILLSSHAPKNMELKIGDELDVMLTDLNPSRNIIKISVRAIQEKESKEVMKEYMESSSRDSDLGESMTLGDIFDRFIDKKGNK